jgi:hypothetical protein
VLDSCGGNEHTTTDETLPEKEINFENEYIMWPVEGVNMWANLVYFAMQLVPLLTASSWDSPSIGKVVATDTLASRH